jgi:hypothetical protein
MSLVMEVALFILLALLLWPPWDSRPSAVPGGAASLSLPDISPSTQDRISIYNRPASSASPLVSQRSLPPAPPRPRSADELSTQMPGEHVARHREDRTERMTPPALQHPEADVKETDGKAEDRFVHPEVGYAITPPPGFFLTRLGERTVWQGPRGAQLLVETTATPGRSARSGWEELHAVLKRKYGARYRLRGIDDTRLAGRPAAVWDFELDTPAGTRRKRDIAMLAAGRGYGILVSAPEEGFDGLWPQFDAALRSFTLPR